MFTNCLIKRGQNNDETTENFILASENLQSKLDYETI